MKALSIAWALTIVVLCSIPGDELPNAQILAFDKVGHFGMFFVGALLWARTWPGRLAWVLAGGIAFSIATEVYQGVAPFLLRSADPFDVVADVLGLVVGLGVVWWLNRRRGVVSA